ncbi:MAG: molecular chaperone TorD family protein [Usitatibacter sp.]
MNAAASPVTLQRALPPEEASRGDFYALLARLFSNGPDGSLLRALADAPPIPQEGALARAWRDLVDASSAMDADAALEEYEALFAGMGKAAVSLYSGFYAGAPSIDHPRVRIRGDLAAFGLAPRETATEPEDHFSALFDAMRVLVAGGAGRGPASVAEQHRFFRDHVEPGVGKFLQALAGAREANFYRKVAALGAAFFALESESFQLD